MAQKAILFDSGRCTGCQACAAACGKARRAPLPGTDGALGEPAGATADAYERVSDVDGSAVLAVTLRERTVEPHGLVWEFGRKSCVHCASAPCAEVCPTGALERDEETGLVLANDGRCVSCFLCSLACPTDVPRPGGQGGAVSKCDGCVGRVRNDAAPLCVEACPLDALAWGEREDIVAQANERAARLRERGFERACVLGVGEQGGHGVVQVLKYGVEGGEHAPLAATGETPWISGIKMAGPVSLGILGVMGAAAVGTLAWETHREQQSRATAKGAPISMIPGIASPDGETEAQDAAGKGAFAVGKGDAAVGREASEAARPADEFESDAYLDGDFTDEDAAREAEERRAREAAEAEARAWAAAARIVAPTPAAAAAATAAESHLYPVAFAEDAEDDYDDAASDGFDDADLPFVDELGDTGEIPVIGDLGDADDASAVDELGDTGEIPVVDEVGDTGELYNVEDFQRLLAADIVAHHLAKKAAEEDPSEDEDPSEEEAVADGGADLSGEDVAEADADFSDEDGADDAEAGSSDAEGAEEGKSEEGSI